MIKNDYENKIISLSKKNIELGQEIERNKKNTSEEIESMKLKISSLIEMNENFKEKLEKFEEKKSIL